MLFINDLQNVHINDKVDVFATKLFYTVQIDIIIPQHLHKYVQLISV